MNARNSRSAPPGRGPVTPLQRSTPAPAVTAAGGPLPYSPNAALLIDFDNVTMGIRSDLQQELRNLLASDIIKGKVSIRRAYADWRRYPQYVVPLTEASIDQIQATAYGSAKKNATDIRLAIDAMELVFTRPEIGTFILLSGDSDFSSLVIKLKEYSKYVIGVGIRESSSDLLVMSCDEYYSYNALAGLVKSGEEEQVSRDPWELVVEAVNRMKRNGDVMRSDRLKQVMQEIDSTFDEKNLGMPKFSRFTQEAAQRGLLRISKLENGQMEVDVATPASGDGAHGGEPARRLESGEPRARAPEVDREESGRRGRRGRGGRGRERGGEREPRLTAPVESAPQFAPPLEPPVVAPAPVTAARAPLPPLGDVTGERLTREEAFDLVRRAVASLAATEDEAVPATEVRRVARELLGRDSESLNERNFHRILRDAHDADVIDLRKRGDDYEVSPSSSVTPIGAQLASTAPSAAEPSQAARSAANAAALRRGMRPRGAGRGSLPAEVPPELLSIGVVDIAPSAPAPSPSVPATPPPAPAEDAASAEEAEATPRARGRRSAKTRTRSSGRKTARTGGAVEAAAPPEAAPAESGEAEGAAPAPPRRSRARKKTAAPSGGEG